MTALAGCASVPRMPGERRDDQLQALEARVLELAQKSAVQEVELQRLRQQVAALEARLGVRGGASAPAGSSGGGTASMPVTGSAGTGAVAPPV
ncbi:MAG TPA: hypothetical protein VN923_04470, partial [Thermoanaerobaculia bacterium]|nr:hypothetical protein [Thermoanaerobaculia bacterium]